MKVRLNNDGIVKILQSSGELVMGEDLVSTCTAAWFVYPFSAAEANAPVINKSEHPIWSGLYCKQVQIKKHGGGALITAQYEGAEFWSSSSEVHENTVEVSCTMREEPIESHPRFEYWAGEPQDPKCGIFDEDGRFTGWNLKTDGGKIMAGVKSYLVPAYAATVNYISKGVPNLGEIGKIGGGVGLPALGGMYQWMKTGVSFQSMSDGNYKVSENYLSSGPKGWNKYIYG